MNLSNKEQIISIQSRLESIEEILYCLQLMDLNSTEFNALKVASIVELPIRELSVIRNELYKLTLSWYYFLSLLYIKQSD